MINNVRKQEIYSEARELQILLWKRRQELLGTAAGLNEMIPFPARLVAKKILEIEVIEPEEIGDLAKTVEQRNSRTELGGLLDRASNRITVATKFGLIWRRFTMAHEIGHWLLHPNLISAREAPRNGGERANHRRDKNEQEADYFAAELLMMREPLRKIFLRHFGRVIDFRSVDDDIAKSISVGVGRRVSLSELKTGGRRYLALLLANASSFPLQDPITFTRPAVRFGVSPITMAIQFEELGLVIGES